MKNDTFDIPAYKFCILRDNRIDKDTLKVMPKIVFNESQMIPFENVDGLTVGEVESFLDTNPILCMCYIDCGRDKLSDSGIIHTVGTLCLDSDFINVYQDMSIDDAFCMLLEENYFNKEIEEIEVLQKVARCFFERYKDFSHNDTKERVKRLEKKNN